MNILARAMIDIGKEIQSLKDELSGEKYLREKEEKCAKENSELVQKYRIEMSNLNKQIQDWRTKYEVMHRDLDSYKTAVFDLRLTISKLKKRKKNERTTTKNARKTTVRSSRR